MTPAFGVQLVRLSLMRPREGARAILGLGLNLAEAWTALALMSVLVVLFGAVTTLAAPLSPTADPTSLEGVFASLFATPLRFAVLEFASLAFTAAAIFQIGRWAKGRGDLTGALLLVSWLQFLILLLQVALVVIAVVVTQLAGLLTLTFPVLFGWLLTQFVMELHGFTSSWKVFVGIVAAFLGLCIVMTVILISFGIGV